MSGLIKRIDDLERALNPGESITVVVNWDPEPGPAEPGVLVIGWEDIPTKGTPENDLLEK